MIAVAGSLLKLVYWLVIECVLLAVVLPVISFVLYLLFWLIGFTFGNLFVALVWAVWAISPEWGKRKIEWLCNRDAVIAEQRRQYRQHIKNLCKEDRKKLKQDDLRAMREIAVLNRFGVKVQS